MSNTRTYKTIKSTMPWNPKDNPKIVIPRNPLSRVRLSVRSSAR